MPIFLVASFACFMVCAGFLCVVLGIAILKDIGGDR
jgi:hypothetical protein